MNKSIMRALGFGEEVTAVERSICPICGNAVDINEFRDKCSLREYRISGLCQSCQDSIFSP